MRTEQVAEKLDTEGGGSFNPRIKPAKSARALAPEECLSQDLTGQPSISAAGAATQTPGSQLQKVVIQFGNSVVKGYLEPHTWDSIEAVLSNAPSSPPQSFRVRPLGSDTIQEIPTADAKAVFYVNDFDGDRNHHPLQFHSPLPIVHGIWVRVEFLDGEVMEGIVHNTLRFLVDPGFFLVPSDPDSNNQLVYVMKNWLKDHRVLGVRKLS
jgi:hypothetical protein